MNASHRLLIPMVCITTGLGTGSASAQAPLDIEGISDRSTVTGTAWFRVPTAAGYTYRVLFDGAPVPTDIAVTNRTADYHEVMVFRTNAVTRAVTNRLVRFIILATDRGDTERGLIRWTPHPVVNSTAAELADAHLEVIAPESYPAGLSIPIVAWIRNNQEDVIRANGLLRAAGHPSIQLRRGVGSGFLAANHPAGPLLYAAQLPGIQTNKTIQIEAGTTWTTYSGVLTSNAVWVTGSRIAVSGSLTVPAGLSLTIREGTVVRLSSGANLTNNGRIVIEGTTSRPVVFTPVATNQPWGGIFCMANTSQFDANGAIFVASGAAQSSYPGHRDEQPLFFLDNQARAALTNCAAIYLAGQFFHSNDRGTPYASFTMVRSLIQRCTTGGEFNGCSLRFLQSAFIEVPWDDGDYGTEVDSDYDGFYLNAGVHELRDGLLGWMKDDCMDAGSGGGPTTVTVTNCWIEAAYHEGCAWSGGSRIVTNQHVVAINSGQGIECGWSGGSGTTPAVYASDCLSLANSVGFRFGDNYVSIGSGFNGFLRVTNSLALYNYRDVYLKTWNNPGTGWQTNSWVDRLQQADLRGNFLTAPDPRFTGNQVWNPALDGWRLRHWMTTPPNAPVGIGIATWASQFAMSAIFDGVPVRLSSFTTNFVTVNFGFENGTGATLATSSVTFAPGETLKRIHPAGFDVWAQSMVRVVLLDAVNGELTGTTNVTFTGSVPPPQVSLWVATNALPSYRLPEGMLVKLSTPAGMPVTVNFAYSADGVVLGNGSVYFEPGETVRWIEPTGIDPAAAELIELSLSAPVGAALADITTLIYGTPPVQVSFATGGSSQLDLATFPDGLPVALNRVTTNDVTVDFRCERSGAVLTNGTITIAAGQAVWMLDLPTVDPDQHDLLRVSLTNPAKAKLGTPSSVVYTRVELGQSPFLVRAGSTWKYLDTGGNAGTAWREREYDDSGWLQGPAQLGFSDGEEDDEATLIRSVGTNGQGTITFYFRQRLVVMESASFTNLAMWLLRDDGGVVYLNGTEVFRSPNMPGGAINYTTTTVSGQNGENTVDRTNLSPGLLLTGTNVVAVEIHQQGSTSSDVSFDFSLTGAPTPPPPPQHLLWGNFSGENLLSWGDPSFVLQQSDKVTGPWTNRVGAVSPFVVTPGPGNAFFRLRR